MGAAFRTHLLVAMLATASAFAADERLTGVVLDPSGAPVPFARVSVTSPVRRIEVVADARGGFAVDVPQSEDVHLIVTATGFGRVERVVAARNLARRQRIVLPVPAFTEQTTVTATRGAVPAGDTGPTVVVLPREVLESTASPALDAALLQVPGFALFRRSDSRTANPTSQGVSLRGLGASGASRALVLDDGVPLNDPFGGWVYWDRVPQSLVTRVEVEQGGGSDLYGSGAMGGVVNVIRRPGGGRFLDGDVSVGSSASRQVSLAIGDGRASGWSGMTAVDAFTTRGYVPVEASQRGPIDIAAGSRHAVLDVSVRHPAWKGLAFARGSVFGESRDNGTPAETNNTRVVQVAAGAQWPLLGGGLQLRAYAIGQTFNQVFSAVTATRSSERITGLQHVPAHAAGSSAQWSRAFGRHTLIGGFEYRQANGSTNETVPGPPTTSFANRGGRQGTAGLYLGDTLSATDRFSVTAGVRLDRSRSDEGHAIVWSDADALPQHTQFPAHTEAAGSPRVSAVYRLASAVSLSATTYRAFRAPTLNELYRSFRVGNVVTLGNPSLSSERVTGGESSVTITRGPVFVATRAFWLTMRDAVANVTIGAAPGAILRERQNLGRVRSRGAELEVEWRPSPAISAHASYLVDDARVTSFPANSKLVGLRVPQQPRNGATFRLRVVAPNVATFAVQGRWVGLQYDDDLNQLGLDAYGSIDAMASRPMTRTLEIFVAGENLANSRYEIARTPVTTIGWPRSMRVGARIAFGR